MANVVKMTTAEARPRAPGGFVRTDTAADILRSLELVRSIDGTAMTMIAGAPGVGKSRTLFEFCAGIGYDAIVLTVASGEGSPFDLATELARMYRENANGKSLAYLRDMFARWIGPGRLIAVDEAQYLTPKGAEWLRALAEDGGIDLVLCGDLALSAMVEGIPQLRSRMVRPVLVAGVSEPDVSALATEYGYSDALAVKALHAVACRAGGLRNVQNVLRLAKLFAGAAPPDLGHLKAAIIDMKLGMEGKK
jgi:hypothetical protein